jgi:transposase
MRFVPVKSADQQAVLMLHRARALLIRQQTMLANAFRAHLAEFGIVVPQGIRHVRALIESLASDEPGKPAVGNDPRRGVYYSHGHCRDCGRSFAL